MQAPSVHCVQYNDWYKRFCLWLMEKVYVVLIACMLCASNHWRTCNMNIMYCIFGLQKLMFVWSMSYALVCKMNVVSTMKYALVCKMNVCMYHACFLYWHELAKTMCPDFVPYWNCLNCNWKRVLVLTLLNTMAKITLPMYLHLILFFIKISSSVACFSLLLFTYWPAQVICMEGGVVEQLIC